MGREQVRNIEAVKVGTTELNEFEYERNQGQLTEQLEHQPGSEQSEIQRPTRAEQVQQITAAAHAKVEKRRRRAGKKAGAKKSTPRTSTAKKSTAKKSAAKKSTKKSAVKKSTAKKAVARKPSTRKSAAKKSAGKKSTTRKSARKR